VIRGFWRGSRGIEREGVYGKEICDMLCALVDVLDSAAGCWVVWYTSTL
jgi:hypothetical protein